MARRETYLKLKALRKISEEENGKDTLKSQKS